MNINTYLEQLQIESVNLPSNFNKILQIPIKDLEKLIIELIKKLDITLKKPNKSNFDKLKQFIKPFPKFNFKEVKKYIEKISPCFKKESKYELNQMKNYHRKSINELVALNTIESCIYGDGDTRYEIEDLKPFKSKFKKLKRIYFF